jgi:predicted Zn-dependent protease
MGYIAQRSGDYKAAAQYLNRAASQGGDASEERKNQAADAAFYGQLAQAQQALKEGNISQALALSSPLAQESGERGTAGKLFRAAVLRQNKDFAQAEQTLRGILNDQPQNAPARENLYYVLRDQNKTEEAQAMLRTLPASLQKNCSRAWWRVHLAIRFVVRHSSWFRPVTLTRLFRCYVRALPACRMIRGCVWTLPVCCKNPGKRAKRQR